MSDMRLSCRDSTNQALKIQNFLETQGLVGSITTS